MDATSETYAANVARAMTALWGSRLVGVYLHGSAVPDGFDVRRSDVDVLVVCKEPITPVEQSAAADSLSEERLPCPARGLELSIVTLGVTQRPSAKPAYELHITTASDDTKVVDGHQHMETPTSSCISLFAEPPGACLALDSLLPMYSVPYPRILSLLNCRSSFVGALITAPTSTRSSTPAEHGDSR
jgi:predicted nucleotidyltransferase